MYGLKPVPFNRGYPHALIQRVRLIGLFTRFTSFGRGDKRRDCGSQVRTELGHPAMAGAKALVSLGVSGTAKAVP